MALSASDIYHLTVEQLRQACVEGGLDSDGLVRILRRRLGEQFKREGMEPIEAQDIAQVVPRMICRVAVLPKAPLPRRAVPARQ